MEKIYVLICDEEDYAPSIFPQSFSSYEKAKETALERLKESYPCEVMESYDAEAIDALYDCEFIVEDELAHYVGDRIEFQYIIDEVPLPPKGG